MQLVVCVGCCVWSNQIQWHLKFQAKHINLSVVIQDSCARVLLFRGANKEIKNYNSQTAFQVCMASIPHCVLVCVLPYLSCLTRQSLILLWIHWLVINTLGANSSRPLWLMSELHIFSLWNWHCRLKVICLFVCVVQTVPTPLLLCHTQRFYTSFTTKNLLCKKVY